MPLDRHWPISALIGATWVPLRGTKVAMGSAKFYFLLRPFESKTPHRKGAWPPKVQTMCNPNSLFDISRIRTRYGPLADYSRPNATALWIGLRSAEQPHVP